MNFRIPSLAFVSVAFAKSVFASSVLTTPWIANPANGHWYALTTQSHWVDSEVAAIANGGHLATINNQAEQDFVYQTFQNWGGQQRLLWIGLNDYENNGQWRWSSGEPVAYTNWAVGEPNNAGIGEQYVSIYPESLGGGGWNDFGHLQDAFGAPAYGLVERDPANPVSFPVHVSTGLDWKVLAPDGNKIGQDLNTVGLEFEAAHPDWFSNVSFDTSTWSSPTQVLPSDAPTYIWGGFNTSPVYFRHTFSLADDVSHAVLLATVDDNALLYINGQLVINDPAGGASGFGPLDVTPYLHAGVNLIAAKTQDIGVARSFSVDLYATYVVPEPSSAVLALMGMILLSATGANRFLRRRTDGG